MINGAQALMESLKREGVERVFGYAGATICPAVDALAGENVKVIVTVSADEAELPDSVKKYL